MRKPRLRKNQLLTRISLLFLTVTKYQRQTTAEEKEVYFANRVEAEIPNRMVQTLLQEPCRWQEHVLEEVITLPSRNQESCVGLGSSFCNHLL
jgi:hypothetical protein